MELFIGLQPCYKFAYFQVYPPACCLKFLHTAEMFPALILVFLEASEIDLKLSRISPVFLSIFCTGLLRFWVDFIMPHLGQPVPDTRCETLA